MQLTSIDECNIIEFNNVKVYTTTDTNSTTNTTTNATTTSIDICHSMTNVGVGPLELCLFTCLSTC